MAKRPHWYASHPPACTCSDCQQRHLARQAQHRSARQPTTDTVLPSPRNAGESPPLTRGNLAASRTAAGREPRRRLHLPRMPWSGPKSYRRSKTRAPLLFLLAGAIIGGLVVFPLLPAGVREALPW